MESNIKIDKVKLLKETRTQNNEGAYIFLFSFIVVGEAGTPMRILNRFGTYKKPQTEFETEDYTNIMKFLELNYITEAQEEGNDNEYTEYIENLGKGNESSENSKNFGREARKKNFKNLVLLGISPWGKYKDE